MDIKDVEQDDQVKIYCSEKCCFNISVTMLTALLYIAYIIVPFVSEIIAAVYNTSEQRTTMIVVCGSIQIILAMLGGCMMGKEWFLDDKKTCGNNDFTNFRSMFTASYILLITPQWLITNVVVWIVNGGSSQPLGVALAVFMPVPIYILSLFAGYGFEYAYQKEVESIV